MRCICIARPEGARDQHLARYVLGPGLGECTGEREQHRTTGKRNNHRPGAHAPVQYELRIEGHLDEHWSAWFGGLVLTREGDGTTTLSGAVTDQAELHGLLSKVRDLGTTLISVKLIEAPPPA